MNAHPLLLLDSSSSLAQTLSNIANALFQVPVIIAALVLTFVCAIVAWLIAYTILRHKDTCSMVCSIHFFLTIATIVLGLLSAIGLIDHYFPGSLITGSGVALLVLTIPLFILVESFEHVVLGNKHARMHRELRTPQDRSTRRGVVFLTPLAIGAILLVVGLIIAAAGAAVSALAQAIILLLVLWVLAIGAELLILALASRRRRRLDAMGTGAALSREEVASLWVSGFSSYRIGRGRLVFTETTTVVEREAAWGEFTKGVFITEDLLFEEEGELDLVQVEAEEVDTYSDATGASILALHDGHRSKRRQAENRFFRRWSGALLLLLVALAVVAVIVIAAGSIAVITTAGIALAFLAPVIFLIIHRSRRDSDLGFARATAEKVSTVQYSAVAVQEAVIIDAPTLPPTPSTRRTTGSQTAVPLHPARPVPVTPPIAEPEIPAKEEAEPPTLPSIETAEAAGAAHENPDIADDTIIIAGAAAAGAILAGAAGAAHENPDIADDTLLIGHAPVTEVSDNISIIEFQRYLRGIHYPATREQLIAQARSNNAPPNMIARLELLEEGYTFISASEVMRGYAYHRYLRGVRYPATRDQLLAHARANNAPPRLIGWLEGLETTVVFVSLVEVLRSHTTYLQEKGEESAEESALSEETPAATAAAVAASASPDQISIPKGIRITEFQHYLRGVDYPVTREQLIAHARSNNAPPNMIARLEELDETHSFISVRDVMIGYAYHRYLRGVTYPATRDQLLAHARANNAPKKLILWIETLSVTVTFVSLTEVVRSYASHHEEEEVVEEAEASAPAAEAPVVSSRIGIIEFQRYLHGVDYPATRAQLIEQARANNAPPNMIARLEELDETHSFINVRDVMIGIANHRYLRGVTYPATRDQLLAHARANNAPKKLILWIETLTETVTFASLTEVVRSYSTHQVEEDDDDEDDEKTITVIPTSEADEGLKGIGVREFAHHLRGIHYPVTRDQLLERARENEAPANMIARLEKLPEHHRFTGMTDVMRGYGHHISEEEGN